MCTNGWHWLETWHNHLTEFSLLMSCFDNKIEMASEKVTENIPIKKLKKEHKIKGQYSYYENWKVKASLDLLPFKISNTDSAQPLTVRLVHCDYTAFTWATMLNACSYFREWQVLPTEVRGRLCVVNCWPMKWPTLRQMEKKTLRINSYTRLMASEELKWKFQWTANLNSAVC